MLPIENLDALSDSGVASQGEVGQSGAHQGMGNMLHALYSVNPESVSKVVDKNGEPLVVWHGGREFTEFHDKPEAGAHYATTDVDAGQTFADQYGDGELKPLFLNMRNPLELAEMPRSTQWADNGQR